MPTPTDERRDLLTVIAYMHAKPGKEGELRAALDPVAGVDDPAAGVELLEFELPIGIAAAIKAIKAITAIKASDTSNSNLGLKEGSCGVDAGLRH